MSNFLNKINDYYNNEKNNDSKVLNDLYNNPNTQDIDLEKNLDPNNNVLNTSIDKTINPIYDTETKGGLKKPKEEPKVDKIEDKNVENTPITDKNSVKTDSSKENTNSNDKLEVNEPTKTTEEPKEEPKIDKLGNQNVEITPEYQSMVSNSLPDKDKPTLKTKILHKLGRMAMGGLKGAAYSMANMQDTGKMVGNIYVPSHSFGSGGLNAVRQDIQNETVNKQNQQRLDIAKEKIEADTLNNINTNEAKAKQQEITNKINQQNADTQKEYAEARANDLKHTIQKENKQEFENKISLLKNDSSVENNDAIGKEYEDNLLKAKSTLGTSLYKQGIRTARKAFGDEAGQSLANLQNIVYRLAVNNIRQSDLGDRGVLSDADMEIFKQSVFDPNATLETNINSYNTLARKFNSGMQAKAKMAGLSDDEMKNLRQMRILNIDNIEKDIKETK